METASLLSIDEYLETTYRPDCDYVDGELQERSLGKYDHSNLQRALILYLGIREREWNIRALPEQRFRVGATRVRIPDVCILQRDQPIEQTFTRPPLVCIEVLSETDTLNSTRARLEDYGLFGVPNLWVFDPADLKTWTYRAGDYQLAAESIGVPGTEISIKLADLFALLD